MQYSFRMNHKNKKMKISYKKYLLFTVILLIIIGGIYWISHDGKPEVTKVGNDSTGEKIDYSPPTEEDKQESDNAKQRIIDQQNQNPQTTSSGKQKVSPIITSVTVSNGNVDARGFVSGIIEEGGTCTFTFTKGLSSISKTSQGIADASVTRCAPLAFTDSSIKSGSGWSVTLKYNSVKAEGVSVAKTI